MRDGTPVKHSGDPGINLVPGFQLATGFEIFLARCRSPAASFVLGSTTVSRPPGRA